MTETISIPAGKLRLMLTAVLPHAGTDDTLPALCGVNFEMVAGTLYLVATDRYTLAVAREQVPGAAESGIADQSALLPDSAAWELRRMLKKRTGVAAIMIEDGKLSVTDGSVSGSWATPLKSDFPKWRGLLHGALAGTQEPLGDDSGLDARKVARLTAGAERTREALSVRFMRPAKKESGSAPVPMLVATVGDWFVGAVMPMRLGDTSVRGAAAQWESWTAVTAPAAEVVPEHVPEVAGV